MNPIIISLNRSGQITNDALWPLGVALDRNRDGDCELKTTTLVSQMLSIAKTKLVNHEGFVGRLKDGTLLVFVGDLLAQSPRTIQSIIDQCRDPVAT